MGRAARAWSYHHGVSDTTNPNPTIAMPVRSHANKVRSAAKNTRGSKPSVTSQRAFWNAITVDPTMLSARRCAVRPMESVRPARSVKS